MSYQVGRGGMLDGLDEALAGMSAGEQKTFTSQLVGGDLVGEDVEVEVTVTSVKEQDLPELDDDFAQTASEFDTVEELTEDVRARLSRGKRLEQAAAARDAVLEKLLDLVDVPLPDGVVELGARARREQIDQQLAMAGMTMEQYLDNEKQTVDEFEADLEKRVRDAVAAQFVLDQVAKSEEIGVNEERAPGAPACGGPSSPDRTRRSSSSTCSSTTTSPRWSPRWCAARRWPRSSSPQR